MRVGNTNRYLTTTRRESYTLFFERNVNTPLIRQTSASAVVGAEPWWIINTKSSIRTVILPDNMLAIVASRTINDHMPYRHHKSLRDLTLWSFLDRPVNLKTNKMSAAILVLIFSRQKWRGLPITSTKTFTASTLLIGDTRNTTVLSLNVRVAIKDYLTRHLKISLLYIRIWKRLSSISATNLS